MAKKKIEYAEEETPEELDRDNRIRDDLRKLNSSELLFSEYSAIYKRLMKHKNMTPVRAHALSTCGLIKKNNSNLLSLLEEYGFTFPD
jgi:hypothetical protein